MPLIIITGYPCSGKTHRAVQIASEFANQVTEYNAASPNARPLSVQHIQSRHSVLTSPTAREEIYTSATAEKTARGAEFSAIKRAVNKETVVIADSGNYIKGYRYQLWCEAKAAGTRCCVVHVASREDEVEEWNRARAAEAQQDISSNGVEKVKGAFMDQPESHTLLYGDRRLGGDDDDDGLPETLKAKRKKDTGYGVLESDLKSLYINPRIPEKDDSVDGSAGDKPIQPAQPIPSHVSQSKESSSISLQETTPSFPPLSPPYTSATLHSLISRYEPPSPFSRWDTPLFTIPSSDAHPPYAEIWTAIFPHLTLPSQTDTTSAPNTASSLSPPSSSTTTSPSYAPSLTSTATSLRRPNRSDLRTGAVKPHAATVLPTATSSEALQILERATQTVVKHLLEWSKSNTISGTVGDEAIEFDIPLPNPKGAAPTEPAGDQAPSSETLIIPPNTPLTLPVLQRLRRRYVQVQRTAASRGGGTALTGDERRVVSGFVRWIGEEMR